MSGHCAAPGRALSGAHRGGGACREGSYRGYWRSGRRAAETRTYLLSAPAPLGDAKGHQQTVLGNVHLNPAVCALLVSRAIVPTYVSAIAVPNLSRYLLNGVELSHANVS